MNHLLDDDDDLNARPDRELTLSTGAILGIFLGLVLVCGLFFAFGYNLGQKSKGSTATVTDAGSADNSSSTTSGHSKPSAGSFTAETSVKPQASSQPTTTVVQSPAQPAPEPAPVHVTTTPAPVTRPAAPVSAPMPATSASGTFVVQIAAVSRQDDANMLVSALRGRGYSVAARTEPNDRLIHIQVGPFDTKAEAAAMRDRLLGDGYNAIVK